MAVVGEAHKVWQGRVLTEEKEATTYAERWQVQVTDQHDDATDVREAPGLPVLSDQHPNDKNLFVRRRRFESTDSTKLWFATIEYSSEENFKPPLDRKKKRKWSFLRYSKVAQIDQDGKAILNSANERFDPPAEVDDSRIQLVITRNEGNFDAHLIAEFQDAVNSDVFYDFQPGEAKMMAISANEMEEKNPDDPNAPFQFWEVEYEIQFRLLTASFSGATRLPIEDEISGGWFLEILDQGFNEIGPDGKIKPILLTGGVKPSSPVLLDGTGHKLTWTPPALPNPFFQKFKVYREMAFRDLNLEED